MSEPAGPQVVAGAPAVEGPLGDTSGHFTPAPAQPDPDDPARWEPGTFIEHGGQRFRVAESVGLMSMMDFAEVADDGVDANALAGLAAMKRLLRDLIDGRDWHRFHAWTREAKLDGEQLGLVISKAMEIVGSRETPTGSPYGSPGGASTTGPRLSGISGGAASQLDAWTEKKRLLGLSPVGDG
jgi:hypothetical protein